jgi:hypothetical protein
VRIHIHAITKTCKLQTACKPSSALSLAERLAKILHTAVSVNEQAGKHASLQMWEICNIRQGFSKAIESEIAKLFGHVSHG